MNDIGTLIRAERLARHWSQEGLCRGICAVSYLSKIEQGQVTPSEEIRRLLLERLGLPTEEDTPALREAAARLERMTELLFLGDTPGLYALEDAFEASRPLLARSRYAAQAALLHEAMQPMGTPLPAALECGLDERLLAYQRILQGRCDEALRLYPHAFTYCSAGNAAYRRGDYRTAIELLRHAHTLAAEDDAVHLMLQSRAFLGNCYCNELRLEQMEREYAAALRLAELLHNTNLADTIRYNIAAGQLEGGQYEAAYAYFPALENPGRMARCTSWPSAAKSSGGRTKPALLSRGRGRRSATTRRRRCRSRSATLSPSGSTIRTICSGRNTARCCSPASGRCGGSCPRAMRRSTCRGCWNGTPPTGATRRRMS